MRPGSSVSRVESSTKPFDSGARELMLNPRLLVALEPEFVQHLLGCGEDHSGDAHDRLPSHEDNGPLLIRPAALFIEGEDAECNVVAVAPEDKAALARLRLP